MDAAEAVPDVCREQVENYRAFRVGEQLAHEEDLWK